eukprot:CAMPEP_0168813412 /NCGR_PEP_ID=MMETSP0726-20121227/5146_1 /TAXON_ID=265536 /ORGANISM="Amphiprora sp., Strain CCMP467" /LENGTH=332 /DNA_ID=CAMNT_0008865543 /DNA_START=268 /DNA_END=1262 /DNA_ORIENTATION=+
MASTQDKSCASANRMLSHVVDNALTRKETFQRQELDPKPFLMALQDEGSFLVALEEERRLQRRQRRQRREELKSSLRLKKQVSFGKVETKNIPARVVASPEEGEQALTASAGEMGGSLNGAVVSASDMLSELMVSYLNPATVCECLAMLVCREETAKRRQRRRKRPKLKQQLYTAQERKEAIVDILRPLAITLPAIAAERAYFYGDLGPRKAEKTGEENSTLSSDTPGMCSLGSSHDEGCDNGCPLCDTIFSQNHSQFRCPHCSQCLHNGCVADWMGVRKHQKCPCCRKEIISDEMILESVQMVRSTKSLMEHLNLKEPTVPSGRLVEDQRV